MPLRKPTRTPGALPSRQLPHSHPSPGQGTGEAGAPTLASCPWVTPGVGGSECWGQGEGIWLVYMGEGSQLSAPLSKAEP